VHHIDKSPHNPHKIDEVFVLGKCSDLVIHSPAKEKINVECFECTYVSIESLSPISKICNINEWLI
jgi:hypothetical protein